MIRKQVTFFLLLVAVLQEAAQSNGACSLPESQRFDCALGKTFDQHECESQGCCWSPSRTNLVEENAGSTTVRTGQQGLPSCFYPANFPTYQVEKREETKNGFRLTLRLYGSGGPFANVVQELRADFLYQTQNILRVKITDNKKRRYEVPVPTPSAESKASNPNYNVSYGMKPFTFSVGRKSTRNTIFDSNCGGFVFSDQFIQVSSYLPSHNIYGLGEHVLPLKLDTNWLLLTLWAHDIQTPVGGGNLYGVHPFYMNIEEDGNANGVLFLNSNAMDILLQPTPAITYRTIGGVIDFLIFLGPRPDDVIQQYTDVIGKPIMPPYWALGFHLCRWGYKKLSDMKSVVQKMKKHGIPQDVQWVDIDYMVDNRDFTVDPVRYNGFGDYVKELHQDGIHFVPILDPAVSNAPGYFPYTRGLELNVFIKHQNNEIVVGKVWPGWTVYPDFFHPNASIYSEEMLRKFHQKVPFDGVWIDMNEPSNFVPGAKMGCPASTYENPPYLPGLYGKSLIYGTLCMTAKQHVGIHYNLHNVYGYSQGKVTMSVLQKILGRRSIVMGRSTYPGSGAHQGHWLGDNHSNWDYLASSIAEILTFNLFGIPLVGADICGFQGNSNEELCSRWMQLGAFYPFSRNQNSMYFRAQDPTAFGPRLINASRSALMMRYKLLPYLYTLYHLAHTNGSAVARPLFYEFPFDKNTLSLDKQFLWGKALLITPVLTKGATSVSGYFPNGLWYDINDGVKIDSNGRMAMLQGAFDRVNVHVRGGYIIPTQRPAVTTRESRTNPFGLIVAADRHGRAAGYLYLDDGNTIDPAQEETSVVAFFMVSNIIRIYPEVQGFIPKAHLGDVTVFGVPSPPSVVAVNGRKWSEFSYNAKTQVLSITDLKLNIVERNIIKWV